MKLVVWLLLCVVLLGGCESANQWSTAASDPTMQKFSTDWAECQKENPALAGGDALVGTSKARDCMRAKGYSDAKK